MEDDLQLQIYLERKRMLELELKEGWFRFEYVA